MRILFISNMYPSARNPSYGIFVKNTFEMLKDEHDIKLITLKQHKFKSVKAAAYLFFYVKTILTGIINRYDCIYAHFISHCELPVRIIKYFRKDVIVVGNVHGEDVFSDFEEFQGNWGKAKKFMEEANYIIAPSEYYKRKINTIYRFNLEKIHVSPSGGINTMIFYPDNQSKCREHLGLEQSAYYLGYVSRIEKGKGWETFLKAFCNIRNHRLIRNIKAILVGNGSEEPELDQLIEELDLTQDIKRYHMVSQRDLHYLYNSFSLFCFPTSRTAESLGLVGLEAMACGIPCVIADADGPMSYAKNGINALIFRKGNVNDLEEKVLQCYNMNPDIRKRIKNAAYETAQMYSAERTKKRLTEIFKMVEENEYNRKNNSSR